MAGGIIDEDGAFEIKHVREFEWFSDLWDYGHSKPVFERIERAMHGGMEFSREKIAEGEDVNACEQSVNCAKMKAFEKDLPRDSVVTGAVRKFHSSIWVFSCVHSGHPLWNGFFRLISMFNFILKVQMFQVSSCTVILSTPEANAPLLATAEP